MTLSMRQRAALSLACGLALLGFGCGRAPSPDASPDASESGLASFYATKFQGRSTASGETYDETALTAAHRTLPFGTEVRVTRVSNGRSVIVRINDRGPRKKERVIDLSRAAADSLDMLREGLATVRLDLP
jgi:rare lipoprotein A